MSEPEAAFLKLQITREALVRWLDALPSPATRWNDWRLVGGQWYLDGGPVALVDASDEAIAGLLREADARLANATNNRDLLRRLVTDAAEAPELHLAAFDERGDTFIAGSLTFSENLSDFFVFLAMARGIADYLEPTGYGLAIIHNYLWGGEEEQTTTAALRMMPSGESQLLQQADWSSVAPAFQSVADALTDGRLPPAFSIRDEPGLWD